MKLPILVGCLLLTSVCIAQQNPQKAPADSLRNPDHMPIVRDIGHPARMPVQSNTGTPVAMPTRRMGAPAQSEMATGKQPDLLKKQLDRWGTDSLNQPGPRSGPPHPRK